LGHGVDLAEQLQVKLSQRDSLVLCWDFHPALSGADMRTATH
jgi:hypothetical protein